MLFPKGVGGLLEEIRYEVDMCGAEFEVFGVDWGVGMGRAKQVLGDKFVLQGNLEPALLYDRAAMESGVDEIVRIMGKQGGHIFNLGHGIAPRFAARKRHSLSANGERKDQAIAFHLAVRITHTTRVWCL